MAVETNRAAWQAKNLFAEKSLASNVGQYNLGAIIDELSPEDNLLLKIPAINDETINLKVPGVIILEWKIIVGNIAILEFMRYSNNSE